MTKNMYFIYINQHESVWESDWSWSVVTLDSQQVPQVRHSLTRGEANCKLPD